jgi:ABC-2 type transport system ATP-binding protein
MEEAERCDRVAILHQGSLVALGEPSELKAGVGGDVLVLQGAHPARLVERLRSELGLVASVVDSAVRIERPGAHELVPRIVAALGDDVTTVTYGRPTLEDVFVHHTGQRFWSAEQGA